MFAFNSIEMEGKSTRTATIMSKFIRNALRCNFNPKFDSCKFSYVSNYRKSSKIFNSIGLRKVIKYKIINEIKDKLRSDLMFQEIIRIPLENPDKISTLRLHRLALLSSLLDINNDGLIELGRELIKYSV